MRVARRALESSAGQKPALATDRPLAARLGSGASVPLALAASRHAARGGSPRVTANGLADERRPDAGLRGQSPSFGKILNSTSAASISHLAPRAGPEAHSIS